MADLNTPYGTRLCLSGLESRKLLETFADFKVKHIQVSYYYLRKVFQDPQDFESYAAPFSTVLIDSGTVYQKFRTEDEKQRFIEDYAGYIGGLNKHVYTACVYEKHSNLEKLVPEDALIYPLDMMADLFDNRLDDVMRNLKYVGIAQSTCIARGGEDLVPIFKWAKQYGTYIHAFGTSSKRILGKYPFYSANTSSWRSGSRYLNTYIYEGVGRGLKLYQPSNKQDPLKKEVEMRRIRKKQLNRIHSKQGALYTHIDKDKLEEGDSWEVDKANLTQWMQYQTDLETNAKDKYFLSEESQRALIEARRNKLTSIPPAAHIEENIDKNNTHPPIEEQYIEGGIKIEDSPIRDIDNSPIDTENMYREDDDRLPANIDKENTIVSATARIYPVDPRMRVLRQCNDCVLQDRCVEYREGGSCAYGLPPDITPDPNDTHDVIREQIIDTLVMQQDRVHQAVLEEKLDAAGPSKDAHREIKLLMDMHRMYMEMINPQNSLLVKAKGPGVLDMFKKR